MQKDVKPDLISFYLCKLLINLTMLTHIKIDKVISSMINLLSDRKAFLIDENQKDLSTFKGDDQAMYDRLVMNEHKIDLMIESLTSVMNKPDPVNKILYSFDHPKGMQITNRTSPFGTILIIYESRPDVTIEAAVLAFKAGNKILLKGGKEARHSNLALTKCWKDALTKQDVSSNYIKYLDFDRNKTQAFLIQPDQTVDLIVPRGGEKLIEFVKSVSKAPVLVSGRGNNFLFIDKEANWEIVEDIVINAKTDKISACNALDKVLIHQDLPLCDERIHQLILNLKQEGVEVIVDNDIFENIDEDVIPIPQVSIWGDEFLAMKIVIGKSSNVNQAIEKINEYSGKHSASIITTNAETANHFMNNTDVAAVYHNASTRFTDGGEFGMGAELAISTDKLHHRGPLGLDQLVTNKWYILGNGQVK